MFFLLDTSFTERKSARHFRGSRQQDRKYRRLQKGHWALWFLFLEDVVFFFPPLYSGLCIQHEWFMLMQWKDLDLKRKLSKQLQSELTVSLCTEESQESETYRNSLTLTWEFVHMLDQWTVWPNMALSNVSVGKTKLPLTVWPWVKFARKSTPGKIPAVLKAIHLSHCEAVNSELFGNVFITLLQHVGALLRCERSSESCFLPSRFIRLSRLMWSNSVALLREFLFLFRIVPLS